mmetsp:Transcript_42719/g.65595  ORF Transcript_42719/g.65595 Transcript_42719/m.65595 type:complete len:125 (-) Transcript_42719:40-414(-)
MNLKYMNVNKWAILGISCYLAALPVGVYGRYRHAFSSDFIYNKYHFGVYNLLFCGFGLVLSAKTKKPMLPAAFFLSSIANFSGPGIYEGYYDMKDEPFMSDTKLQRQIGAYSLLGGFAVLWSIY